MSDTRWNGEPCTARRVTATVTDNAVFPAYWARHLVGTRRAVVEVTYGGQTFYLDDEDGSGWNKVTHGGSPHWTHNNITVAPDSVQERVTAPPTATGNEAALSMEGSTVEGLVTAALTAGWYRRAEAGIVASPEEHIAAMAHVLLNALPPWVLRGTRDLAVPSHAPDPAEEAEWTARRESITEGLAALNAPGRGGLTQPEAQALERHVRAELYDHALARAVLADHRAEGKALRSRASVLTRRAESAEAAIRRVRGLRDAIAEALEQADYRTDMQRGDLADSIMPVILTALDGTEESATTKVAGR